MAGLKPQIHRRRAGLVFALAGGALLAVLAVLFVFRTEVVQRSANLLLGNGLRVSTLEGLTITGTQARVDRLELQLTGSGLQLSFDDLEIGYQRPGWFAWPAPAAVLLRRLDVQQTAVPDLRTAPADDSAAAPTLATVLQVLRELPLPSLIVTELTFPQWQETLRLEVAQREGALQLALASGNAELRGRFRQVASVAPAELSLALQLGGEETGGFSLTLTPAAGRYGIDGSAHLDYAGAASLPAQLRPSLEALPLTTARLDLDLRGDVADDIVRSPPARLDVVLHAGSRLALADGVLPGIEGLAIALAGQAQLAVVTGAGGEISSAMLPLQLQGRLQGQPFAADLALQTSACPLDQPASCHLAFSGAASLDALSITSTDEAGSVRLQGLALTGSGTLDGAGEVLRVALDPGLTLAADEWQAAGLQGSAFTLQNNAGLVLGQQKDSGALRFDGEELAGSIGALTYGKYQVSTAFDLRQVRAVLDAGELELALGLQTRDLRVEGADFWLPLFDLAGDLALNPDALDLAGSVQARGAAVPLAVDLVVRQLRATGAGTARLVLPQLDFAGIGNGLSARLAPWPHMADLAEGSLALQADLAWQPTTDDADDADDADDPALALTADLQLRVAGLAGYYDSVFFSGLEGNLDFGYDSTAAFPLSAPPQRIDLAALDAGVPLTGLHAEFALDSATGVVNLDSLRAELFDGAVSASAQRYAFGSTRNELTFRFDGFRLERLLELAQYDGVRASGAVSGEVPLVFTQSGVEVVAGTLHADAPGGSIRYLGVGGSGGNPALDLVNQALANYQYESLESSIDYRPDGELLLGMRLQGFNPDMNQEQRINLNLNLSNNIPSLLESLQAGREIEDFLQKQFE